MKRYMTFILKIAILTICIFVLSGCGRGDLSNSQGALDEVESNVSDSQGALDEVESNVSDSQGNSQDVSEESVEMTAIEREIMRATMAPKEIYKVSVSGVIADNQEGQEGQAEKEGQVEKEGQAEKEVRESFSISMYPDKPARATMIYEGEVVAEDIPLSDTQVLRIRNVVADYNATVAVDVSKYWPDEDEYPPMEVLFEYSVIGKDKSYRADGACCTPTDFSWFMKDLENIVTENIEKIDENVTSTDEDEATANETDENKTDNDMAELDEVKYPYEFKFVDVFGKEYETEIKESVPKSPYKPENFIFDNGRTYYEDDEYYTRQGIDVSNKQGNINWDKVKASGIDFVIIREGYRGYGKAGNLLVDKKFKDNIEGAQKAGLDVGVYIFAQAINTEEAAEEAELVLTNLEGYELQLPVVYDPESILDAPARTDDVSGEQFTENTICFCEMVKDAGYTPMVYSNMLWEAFEFDMEELALHEYPFWYADYEQLPQTPYAFDIWQYSNEGHVDGIDGAVDLDLMFVKK